MEPEEIRAEIELRRRVAKDLKLRETVWSLYGSQFKYIDDRLKKDPELILPEIRETLKRANNVNEFSYEGVGYVLTYVELKKEADRYGRDETVTTRSTVSLKAGGLLVFEFGARSSITYAREEPLFDESMGEISAFIEGPWVASITELLQRMRSHVQSTWKIRNAPKEAQKLREDMKKFGL